MIRICATLITICVAFIMLCVVFIMLCVAFIMLRVAFVMLCVAFIMLCVIFIMICVAHVMICLYMIGIRIMITWTFISFISDKLFDMVKRNSMLWRSTCHLDEASMHLCSYLSMLCLSECDSKSRHFLPINHQMIPKYPMTYIIKGLYP